MLLPNVRYFLETNLSSEWPFFLINLSALDDIQRWPKPTLILARDLRLDGCLAFDYNMGTSRTSITGSLTFFFRCLSLSLSLVLRWASLSASSIPNVSSGIETNARKRSERERSWNCSDRGSDVYPRFIFFRHSLMKQLCVAQRCRRYREKGLVFAEKAQRFAAATIEPIYHWFLNSLHFFN